jgi:WD40 repeat protein
VAFSPDGHILATTTLTISGGGRLRLWDVTDPRHPTRIASIDDDQYVDAVAFWSDPSSVDSRPEVYCP